jgi:hypothetical protein
MAGPKSITEKSIEFALAEIADQMLGILLLAEHEYDANRRAALTDALTEGLREGRRMGYSAVFTLDHAGDLAIQWMPMVGKSEIVCGDCGQKFASLHAYTRHHD